MTKEHIHLKKIQKRKSKGTCIPSQCRKSLLISPKMYAFHNCITSALEQEIRAYWWSAEDRRQAHGVQLSLHITSMATLSMPSLYPSRRCAEHRLRGRPPGSQYPLLLYTSVSSLKVGSHWTSRSSFVNQE